MPYDGAGATTNVVVAPVKSLYTSTFSYAIGAVPSGSVTFLVPTASRVEVTVRWELGAADMAALAVNVWVFGFPGGSVPNADYFVTRDRFTMYGNEARPIFWVQTPTPLPGANTRVVTRSEQYLSAYPSMTVAVNTFDLGVPAATAVGNFVISVVELGF